VTTTRSAQACRRWIAVVDDEESVRKALHRLFTAFDLDATTFASGRDFLDALPERRPDCLVLDLQMRAPNGFDVLAELAASGARLPVVIITAHDEPETRARCLSAGAAAYLCKPVHDQDLLNAIATAINGSPAPAG
jgi:FixJ family two-component response regulator